MIHYFTIICLTIAKAQMLNKPYIHYIDVKIKNNVSRTTAEAQMLNKPYIHYIDVKIKNNVSRTTVGRTSL